MSNLERLKAAYKAWDACKGHEPDCWLGLFADNVRVRSMGGEARPLAFAQERKSKAEMIAYFSGLTETLSMIHWTPHTFVSEGDRIAVFGTCGWTNKATGKPFDTHIAHLWEFENGKASSVIEIFDSARVLAAATP